MKLGVERFAAGALALAAVGLLGAWSPLGPLRTHSLEARVEQSITRREPWVTPQEVLGLLHDRRVAIELFDLRDDAAYNRFHIADARRLDASALDPVRTLPPSTVKVLVGGDESQALAVYRRLVLAGTTGIYLLEGGAPGWLAAFAGPSCRERDDCGSDRALGDRHPASRPAAELAGKYVPKVRLAAGKKLSGGCGG